MTDSSNSGNRLDRIETALERLIQQSSETDRRIDSNAKSIESLSNQRTENERLLAQDRSRLYDSMARLAAAQADFYTAQAGFYSAQIDMYRRLNAQDELMQTLSRRQGEIVEVLKLLKGQP